MSLSCIQVSSSGFSKTESDEQIAPYGEGEVAAAQRNKTGFGEQEDLASDIDRKKAEQAGLRAQIDSSTGSGGKVQEGQRGGIATD